MQRFSQLFEVRGSLYFQKILGAHAVSRQRVHKSGLFDLFTSIFFYENAFLCKGLKIVQIFIFNRQKKYRLPL